MPAQSLPSRNPPNPGAADGALSSLPHQTATICNNLQYLGKSDAGTRVIAISESPGAPGSARPAELLRDVRIRLASSVKRAKLVGVSVTATERAKGD
jgi:hypothetical protein